MRFIPLQPLVINTPLGPAAARARLAAAVAPAAGSTARGLRPLRGTVGRATFTLCRTTPYPAALLPEFRGRIEPRARGARVTGMVALAPLPVLGLVFVALPTFGLAAEALASAVVTGAPIAPLPLAPLGAVVLAWVLAVRAVTAEARRLRGLVRALLDLASAPDRGPAPRSGAT